MLLSLGLVCGAVLFVFMRGGFTAAQKSKNPFSHRSSEIGERVTADDAMEAAAAGAESGGAGDSGEFVLHEAAAGRDAFADRRARAVFSPVFAAAAGKRALMAEDSEVASTALVAHEEPAAVDAEAAAAAQPPVMPDVLVTSEAVILAESAEVTAPSDVLDPVAAVLADASAGALSGVPAAAPVAEVPVADVDAATTPAAPATAAAEEVSLPAGWTRHSDGVDTWYDHEATGASSWVVPTTDEAVA